MTRRAQAPPPERPAAPPPPPMWRAWLPSAAGLCIVVALAVLIPLIGAGGGMTTLSYSAFLKDVDAGKITSVTISSTGDVTGALRAGGQFETTVPVALAGSSLLGELRFPVIALRAGTSAAQQRCTLAHELVHLERGGSCGGPWSAREELLVHAEAARRLVPLTALADAIAEIGGDHDVGALARLLEVDTETARLRLRLLDAAERARLRAGLNPETWVA